MILSRHQQLHACTFRLTWKNEVRCCNYNDNMNDDIHRSKVFNEYALSCRVHLLFLGESAVCLHSTCYGCCLLVLARVPPPDTIYRSIIGYGMLLMVIH